METLCKVISNILAQPAEAKYRKLRLENAAMQKRVFSVPGGLDFLLALGFESTAGELTLPPGASLDKLQEARVAIEAGLASMAPSAVPAPVAPAPAAPAPAAAPFSADAIASMLNNIQANVPATAVPPAATQPAFNANTIASILGNIQAAAPQSPPIDLNDVLALAMGSCSDAGAQARLAEYLPEGGAFGDTVRETLGSPQLQQAASSFTAALHGVDAQGLIAELRLNPAGYGVEPFLRALQEATNGAATSAGSAAMDTGN